MNIYDIDDLGKFDVNGKDVKTFYKRLSDDKLLGVEAGCGKYKGNDHVYLAFDVKDETVIRKHRWCNRYFCEDTENAPLRLAFACSDIHELEKFIEALEFAVGVLKQAQNLEQDWAF